MSSASGYFPLSTSDMLPSFAREAPYAVKLSILVCGFALLCACAVRFVPAMRTLSVFAYNCFIQPIGKVANQGERLDRFYQNQASGE